MRFIDGIGEKRGDNMKEKYVKELIMHYPELKVNQKEILEAIKIFENCYQNGNKLLVCGNGGSAADAVHIVGELMKSFVRKRELDTELKDAIKKSAGENADYLLNNLQGALPAIALVNEISLMTAYANDVAADLSFAQQVLGYGKEGDILLAISTSGNSRNVIYACDVAKAKGIKVVALTGENGGKLADMADILINVPKKETYQIQELHLPVYHTICLALEDAFWKE